MGLTTCQRRHLSTHHWLKVVAGREYTWVILGRQAGGVGLGAGKGEQAESVTTTNTGSDH